MILNAVIGTGAFGLLSYIANKAKTGNANQQPFFTNMAGKTVRELSREISAIRKLRPNLKKAISHIILSHDPKDRVLTDQEWKHAILIALKVHGAEGAVFAAYIHQDTHHQHAHFFFESHNNKSNNFRFV